MATLLTLCFKVRNGSLPLVDSRLVAMAVTMVKALVMALACKI